MSAIRWMPKAKVILWTDVIASPVHAMNDGNWPGIGWQRVPRGWTIVVGIASAIWIHRVEPFVWWRSPVGGIIRLGLNQANIRTSALFLDDVSKYCARFLSR